MSRARSLCLNGQMDQALDRISRVYEYLASAGYEKLAHQDFGFASHMGYYSDLVFRIYVDDALYSLVSGGRYDKLSEQFGPARPACGFGMNMNLLYEYMTDSGLLDEEGLPSSWRFPTTASRRTSPPTSRAGGRRGTA